MSKVLAKLTASRRWIAHVADERCRGDLIYITLVKGFGFSNDPSCNIRGFNSIPAVREGTRKSDVVLQVIALPSHAAIT